MANMALTSCASLSAPPVSSKSPSKVVGLGPCSAVVSFAVPKKPSLRSGNLVVRAAQSGGGGNIEGGGGNVEGQSLKNIAPLNKYWDGEHPVDIKGPYDIVPIGLEVTFEEMRSNMQDKMREVFEEFKKSLEKSSKKEGEVQQPRIPWEVMNTEKALNVRFDMPGLIEKDVQVTIEGDKLVIKGKHTFKEGSDNPWPRIRYTSYDTRIELPDDCDKDVRNLSKTVKDGVLYVWIPKRSPPTPVM